MFLLVFPFCAEYLTVQAIRHFCRLDVLNVDIGKKSLIARTHRHLYGKVVALRICQDDHFESEEYLVLPEIETHPMSGLEKNSISFTVAPPDESIIDINYAIWSCGF